LSIPHSDTPNHPAPAVERTFWLWRRAHRSASAVVLLLSVLHVGLTPSMYGAWSSDAVWFAGAGLGLLLLAGMNLAHVGLSPCNLPTARAVVVANWIYVAFGISAVVAVPEPQAVVIVVALLVQAVAGRWTLRGTA
jgi:hypothetical protein